MCVSLGFEKINNLDKKLNILFFLRVTLQPTGTPDCIFKTTLGFFDKINMLLELVINSINNDELSSLVILLDDIFNTTFFNEGNLIKDL